MGPDGLRYKDGVNAAINIIEAFSSVKKKKLAVIELHICGSITARAPEEKVQHHPTPARPSKGREKKVIGDIRSALRCEYPRTPHSRENYWLV
jgi:hypothetical protein